MEHTITLELRGYDCQVEFHYDVTSGGSNFYGSDEPAWTEVKITDMVFPLTQKRITKRLQKYILEQYETTIHEILIEQYEGA